jgi:type I restriction enzyme, S subunit
VNDGHIDTEGLKRIEADIAAACPQTRLCGGEVVITLVGAIGRTAVVPAQLAGANTARAIGVIPLSPSGSAHWVELWFRNPSTIERMTAASHEVARKALNLEDVRWPPSPRPSSNNTASSPKSTVASR